MPVSNRQERDGGGENVNWNVQLCSSDEFALLCYKDEIFGMTLSTFALKRGLGAPTTLTTISLLLPPFLPYGLVALWPYGLVGFEAIVICVQIVFLFFLQNRVR